MINNINGAMNAYQQALSRIGTQIPTQETAPASAQSNFQDMVKGAISETIDLTKTSEQMSIQGMQGKADIQDVVQAVANAQTALETVVAVRDTAIKAYQTIMQMPI